MADDRAAVSKIVSKFFLDTCRLCQSLDSDTLLALRTCHWVTVAADIVRLLIFRSHGIEDEFALVPLTAGSVAELYIRPMLKCIGDSDTMTSANDRLAHPDDQPLPTRLPAEFHSRVQVFDIIDSGYPGFVYLVMSYLLLNNGNDDVYSAVKLPPKYVSIVSDNLRTAGLYNHGPAGTSTIKTNEQLNRFAARLAGSEYSRDLVPCVRCLVWPSQAADWPKRHRNYTYSWLDSATVHRVVNNGCDFVNVPHFLCREDAWMAEHQWRVSFSRAEILLLNSWMPVQQIVYHMLRVLMKVERIAQITDSTGSKLLSNYNIKTLMLWACELKPRSWWTDVNVVRICVELLHKLAFWLVDCYCPHYFINNCNLFQHDNYSFCAQHTASWLQSVTESSLADWFITNYVRRCAQVCGDRVTRLFDDSATSVKLERAVSAVVDWRLISARAESMHYFTRAQYYITRCIYDHGLTEQSCTHWMRELANIDRRTFHYFTAVTFLHVAYKITKGSFSDRLLDILATACMQLDELRLYFTARQSSVLSLSLAGKLMRVVRRNLCTTVELIEIELSKAYLHRALRCKDSDNDSIYCLANVYLAVLYYTTGQYQTAIDHCTLVTRSQGHSQYSSHVVQGELLPKIDDGIDNVLGLAVLCVYVRTTALNQQQTQHIGAVFSTKLLASYLYVRCMSAVEGHRLPKIPSATEIQRYRMCLCEVERLFDADVLLYRFLSRTKRTTLKMNNNSNQGPLTSSKSDNSKLVYLLQKSAVEHLTTVRQLETRDFGSQFVCVTTDFEALFAYKRGDYGRCLQLSASNVCALIGSDSSVSVVMPFPEFIQLMDDDIVSVIGLVLLTKPSYREDACRIGIPQLILSLYLMTQCQMRLCHSSTSLAQTLDCIKIARRIERCQRYTLVRLIMKLTEREIQTYIGLLDRLTNDHTNRA